MKDEIQGKRSKFLHFNFITFPSSSSLLSLYITICYLKLYLKTIKEEDQLQEKYCGKPHAIIKSFC